MGQPAIDEAGFAATARGNPSLQVVSGGCGVLEVTTGGRGQPALPDSGGRFATAVHHLLGLRYIP